MNLLELFPEILLEILQLCPPRDLASLSRVHTSMRDVAERVLYHRVYFEVWYLDLIEDHFPWTLKENRSLLHTLSTNVQKAAMVTSLYIELDEILGKAANANHILIKLSHSLKNLSNLVDLGILYYRFGDPSKGRISQVIRGNHFQLQTLWLERGHDLAGIVADQPNLRLLGIYFAHSNSKRHWKKIKGLFNFQNAIPTIVLLKCLESMTPQLEIFPASHRPGQVLQECREIERSLRGFPKSYRYHYRQGNDYHLTFNLFGIREENMNLLAEVMEGIAISFPDMDFSGVEISIDDIAIRPWRFPGFINALPLFESVEDVTFHFIGLRQDELNPFFADIYQCLVRHLGEAWPRIRRVRVRRGCIYDRESDWSPILDALG